MRVTRNDNKRAVFVRRDKRIDNFEMHNSEHNHYDNYNISRYFLLISLYKMTLNDISILARIRIFFLNNIV